MKMRMYCMFDKAISAFTPPFCARTDGEAKRSFAVEVADAKGQIGRHRADYSLFFIGYYDDSLGLCVSESPFVIAEAISVLNDYEEFAPPPGLRPS
ncbi:MAG: nonstructural protein [Microvirus sp.]|nr:MAG: nonstructural protein [Microvirus sp.]